MRKRWLALMTAAAMALAVGACGGDDDDGDANGAGDTTAPAAAETTTTVAGTLEVTEVWARNSPMNATRGAVYMQIANGTATGDALLEASVPAEVAATVEVHETVPATETTDTTMGMGSDTTAAMGTDTTMGMGGSDTTTPGAEMMTMREVDEIAIPAGETVALEPGGYHVMLIDLAGPLTVGDTIDVTLEFREAGTVVVEAEVRETEM